MRVRAAIAALLAALFVAPVSASGAIVVQKGIAGVTLTMTKAQVRAKLGTPRQIRNGRNDFGPYSVFVYSRVQVTFQSGNKATAVETRSALERTVAGVGVGSTTAMVRRNVSKVKCELVNGSQGHCFVGSFKPGARVTDFFVAKGRVTRVVVGFVLD
jgi:hypothetical protein